MADEAPWTLPAVVARIGRHQPRRVAVGELRRAAVLVPLLERAGEVHVLLTLRPSHLRSHAGQVAFPGGRVERGDPDPWHTALREAEEELALPADRVERVGTLDDYLTVTGYHVTPCAGVVPAGQPLIPDEDEVADVFTVPLESLRDPRHVRTLRARRFGARTARGASSDEERLRFYLVGPHVIWGATAAMLTHLLDVLEPR